ncbi:MAG: toxin-antitoxin system HicB family antitoxin [Pseudomonadota bacterium]
MSEANFASLNPTLLARKGGAKPAMRPQLAPLPEDTPDNESSDALEDLGWNDMGGESEESESAKIVSLKPDGSRTDETKADSPVVKRQQKELADRVLANDGGANASVSKKSRSSSKKVAKIAQGNGRRVAFTLRLDPERHLKLKLAATMEGLSAQALVTEALDAKFAEITDLEALIGRIKRN